MTETTPTRLSIRTAEELFSALRHSDLGVRLTTLRVVTQQPSKIRAFGSFVESDLIDELLVQESKAQGHTIWSAVAGALAAFHDPRVSAYFCRLLLQDKRPDRLFIAAARLAQESGDQERNTLLAALCQNECEARARAAAAQLCATPNLDLPSRLRVSLLAPSRSMRVPPIDRITIYAWIQELKGLAAQPARSRLEEAGLPAFTILQEHWETLQDRDQDWLLRWSVQWPSFSASIQMQALVEKRPLVVMAALESLPVRCEWSTDLQEVVDAYAQSPEPTLRLAAIRAGALVSDWSGLVTSDPSADVRQAALARWTEADPDAALPYLFAALRSPLWQDRAAATQALPSAGGRVIQAMRNFAKENGAGIRTAAIQVLLALNDEQWLEEELLGKHPQLNDPPA